MSFEEMDVNTIWMDGSFVDWDEANIHVLTHGLHYGTGVFEGIRCYDTEKGAAIFRWDDHLDRFYNSMKPYGLSIDYEQEELTAATIELISRQKLNSCYIRPIAFYGYGSLGVYPGECPTSISIAAWPWGAYLGEEAIKEGVDAKISSWRKFDSNQIPTNTKATGPYINCMLASEEAKRNGYTEAILLNQNDNIAEGPGENIFLINDDVVYTPGLAESVLDGITRRTVITIARELDYEIRDQATISRNELYTADELFFTGTAAEITPIRRVDNVEIGRGGRGSITEELQTRFVDLIKRRVDDHSEWFTYI